MTPQSPAPAPDRILDVAIGYMGAKQLFAASRIGLFQAIAAGHRSTAQIAGKTGVSERVVRILADTMNGLGLLERTGCEYELTRESAAYLAGGDGPDLDPFLTFLNQISFAQWSQFDRTVDTGEPGDSPMTEEKLPTFMAGVMTYNELHASMLAREFDFSPYRSMLDFGGLSAAFAINAMRANPDLTTRFVFAPEMTEGVTSAVEAAGLADRAVVEGSATETAQPGGEHDLVLAAHVIHRFDAAQNRRILKAARDAAGDGATLLLLDFFLDDDDRQRPIDAMHAGEYLVIDGTVVYPIEDVRDWLESAGWRSRDLLSLPGSPRVLVADAV